MATSRLTSSSLAAAEIVVDQRAVWIALRASSTIAAAPLVTPRLDDNGLVEGGLEPELRRAFVNLRGVLSSAGASLRDVVKTTVFLVDMDDYAAMNEIYMEEFGDHRPARSAVAVAQLPIGARVEIEAVASV